MHSVLRTRALPCILLAAAAVVTGCSTTRSTEVSRLHYQLEQRNEEIERLHMELMEHEGEPAPAVVAMKEAETQTAALPAPGPTDSLLPPHAKPGECYARVMLPPTYETATEEILVKEESESVEIVPAEYEWVEESVVVKEASERIEVIPAEYEMVEEKILITPPSKQLVDVPAEYEWVEEQVLVQPAHTVWKRGNGLIEKVDHATGEIMCLIEVPAKYDTVKKKVVKTPASSSTIEVPAEYKTVQKMVMVKPPTTRNVTEPAEYKTVKVKKLVRPEQKKVVAIPSEYKTVTMQVVKSEGSIGWKRVLCETNLSKDIVTRIQNALKELGYDPGPVDGVIGPQTRSAIEMYQVAKGLAVGGLTYETLNEIGIEVSH